MQNFRLALIFLLTFFSKIISAQEIINTPLPSVLKKIEQQTNLIFNYDPAQISDYSFSGRLNFSQPEVLIKDLLSHTPFEFEKDQQTVLIFLPEKRKYRICGKIQDKKYQIPLALANVFAGDNIQGAQSDENGQFEFEYTGYKNGVISVSYVGYKTVTVPVRKFEATGCKDIFLESSAHLFDGEIVVRDYILDGITEGEAYNSVNLDYGKLAKKASSVEHDILKTAQLIPGVTSVDESASNLQIRGGTADQNLVLWEGATLYDPGHFFGMISSINPFVVDKMKIYKGVFDPSYENRVGGVIDMSLNDSPAEKIRGGIGTTLSEAHAFLEIPFLKNEATVIASGRKSLADLYSSPTLNSYAAKIFQDTKIEDVDESDTVQQVLKFHDLNAKILWQPTDAILLKASWFSSSNDFNFSSQVFEEEYETIDEVAFNSNAVSVSAEAEISDRWSLDLAFRRSDYSNDYKFLINEPEEDESLHSNNTLNNISKSSYSLTNHFRLSDRDKTESSTGLSLGYDLNSIELNFNIEQQSNIHGSFREENFQEADLHNIFLSLNHETEKFKLNSGIRSSFYTQVDFWAFSPRINLQYALSRDLKLKASGGIFNQFISQLNDFGENELGLYNKVWILSESEDEESLRANKFSGGFVFRKGGWLFDFEGYVNSTEGLSSLSPALGSSLEAPDFSTGSSLARGIDFLIKKQWKRYQIWGSYTLGKVTFDFPDESPVSFPAPHDQRHNLSLLTGYKLKNWNFSLTWQYRSGLPFSQPTGINEIYDPEEEDYYYELNFEGLNNSQLNDYRRLDFGVSYRSNLLNSKIQTEISVSVLNLLNSENFFSRNYFAEEPDDDQDDPELFSIVKRQLGITPLVLARIIW